MTRLFSLHLFPPSLPMVRCDAVLEENSLAHFRTCFFGNGAVWGVVFACACVSKKRKRDIFCKRGGAQWHWYLRIIVGFIQRHKRSAMVMVTASAEVVKEDAPSLLLKEEG